jgi:hypothetical protein
MEGALIAFMTRGKLTTARTGRLLMVAVIKSQLRLRQVLDIDNSLGGLWYVTARSIHRELLWKRVRSGSIKGRSRPVHTEFRSLATVSDYKCFLGIPPSRLGTRAVMKRGELTDTREKRLQP